MTYLVSKVKSSVGYKTMKLFYFSLLKLTQSIVHYVWQVFWDIETFWIEIQVKYLKFTNGYISDKNKN